MSPAISMSCMEVLPALLNLRESNKMEEVGKGLQTHLMISGITSSHYLKMDLRSS